MALSARHQQFVAALLADPSMNQTAAYEAVFAGRGNVASVCASKLMARDDIKAGIAEGVAKRLARFEMTADDVLRDIRQIADTNTNELVEWRRGACRYCHGMGFQYQRKPSEYREAMNAYLAHQATKPEAQRDTMGLNFDMLGGVGYDKRKAPHPDCPECFGEGIGWEYLRDTRKLSPGAQKLYNGVKRGKNGVEMLQRSKDKALELAAKHTGVAKENIDLKGNLAGGGVTIYVPDNGRDGAK